METKNLYTLGYSLYELTHSYERSLQPDELPTELLSRWEQITKSIKFCLKKHLFIDGWIDLKHPVEKEFIYAQLLSYTRADRFPLTETEAVRNFYCLGYSES